ncbi:winged helix-turn-helix domain-containing protein [Williamsia sp. CHRR-6]|uniref:winged helix-turn-helix domain-containing protein n=1 Tax=Williamsia sp. CHRR-6 TaxID=2835871 RepID=UPI001BD9CB67|nr:crosslink repair DNA glycosylase YcaQ family protein [Williamsia sp. CHRR-6]MBT0567879.1 YcaQ family DNA glycosylase [Williamsia sp. CHRR-6]
MTSTLSAAQARRIMLAAQGFADPPPAAAPTRAHLKRVVDRVALIQMDSVSVAVRSHYMPLFSRLGPYDVDLLHRAAWEPTPRAPRLLTEYWAHEAALIPVEDWPLFGWRMASRREHRYHRFAFDTADGRRLSRDILAAVADLGPSTSRALETTLGRSSPSRRGTWWDRSDVKNVCEALFAVGELAALRRSGFLRHYGLPADILGSTVAERQVPQDEAIPALLRKAIRALGVATEMDLGDYYRLPIAQTRAVLADLVNTAAVERVTVDGWDRPAYLDPTARHPRRVTRSALLSPFDSMTFFRPRLQRTFGMHYRIEIYVPEPKRQYGYYVFPYLLDESMCARVDLRSDTATGTLQVLGAWAEVGVDRTHVADRLHTDLTRMAQWLGCDRLDIGDRGDLADPLRRVGR